MIIICTFVFMDAPLRLQKHASAFQNAELHILLHCVLFVTVKLKYVFDLSSNYRTAF